MAKKEFVNESELNPSYSYETYRENKYFRENEKAIEAAKFDEETNDAQEQTAPIKKEKKQIKSTTFLSTSLVTAISAAVVGVTNLLNVNMTASMEVSDYNFDTGRIEYVVSVENMTEKETLTAYLYENKTLIDQHNLIDEDGDGKVEGFFQLDKEQIDTNILENDNWRVKYQIKLAGVVGLEVEREFDSYVTTIEKHTVTIHGVDYQCHCEETGYFNFTINYDDVMSSLYDFEAYIEDANGMTSYCTFTENYHEEQQIYVANLGSVGKLYVSYMEQGKDERQYIEFDNGKEQKDNYLNIKM